MPRYHNAGTPQGPPPPRRTPARSSPQRLVRERVGIVHGPIVGCEYRVVRRQPATAGFETQSADRGFVEVGDIVFPVEARPTRAGKGWRLRLALGGLAAGEPRDVWVSELAPDGTPLLEMVAETQSAEEGDPPEMRRIPDVDAADASRLMEPAARPRRGRPAPATGTPSSIRSSPSSDHGEEERSIHAAINKSLSLGMDGRTVLGNFLPLRDFLRQEVHRLCEAVGEAEKQTEEEKTLRHSLEQRLRSALFDSQI